MTKTELIEKLKSCDTLREAGLFWTKDVLDLIESSQNDCDGNCQEEIRKLKEKNDRLSEANKQLRTENKQLVAENKQLKLRG